MLIVELIQSKSALKTQDFRAKKISAKHRWFRADFFLKQLCSALISADIFSSEQRWFRESQSWSGLKQRWCFYVFWISAEQRWKMSISETALFSAEYLWDFNPGTGHSILNLQTFSTEVYN